ncbi:MAG TPA: flagellin, partial [bacterium]|nr:flagellin [bacterium]
ELASQTASLLSKYTRLERSLDGIDSALASIKSADMAEAAMEFYKTKLLQQKTLSVFNYSKLRQVTPINIISKNYK